MRKGQSTLEYLFLIAVALIIVAVIIKYTEPAVKEVPITGIAYIDPELSPEKEDDKTWIIYKYPPECRPIAGNPYCDFYISVTLKTTNNRVYVWAAADPNKVRKIRVQLCTGYEDEWTVAEDSNPCPENAPPTVKCKYMIWGKVIPQDQFPCALYIMAWMR